MNSKAWINKGLSACLIVATFSTYSMVALASGKVLGELTVSGDSVKVNGEIAQSGKTIFSTNTITTPENAGATVNFGKLGSVEIAPNSTMTLNFDDANINGNLTNGNVKVFGNSENAVNITTPSGNVVTDKSQDKVFTVSVEANVAKVSTELGTVTFNDNNKSTSVKAGEMAMTGKGLAKADDDDYKDANGKCIDKNNNGVLECDKGGAAWWIWTAVFGGAAAGILIAATTNNNNVALGGGTTVISPTR